MIWRPSVFLVGRWRRRRQRQQRNFMIGFCFYFDDRATDTAASADRRRTTQCWRRAGADLAEYAARRHLHDASRGSVCCTDCCCSSSPTWRVSRVRLLHSLLLLVVTCMTRLAGPSATQSAAARRHLHRSRRRYVQRLGIGRHRQ